MHRGSHRNLAALQNASDSGLEVDEVFKAQQSPASADFTDEEPRNKRCDTRSLSAAGLNCAPGAPREPALALTSTRPCRMIIVANHLPLRARADGHGGHDFEWDEDALIGQAKVRAWLFRAAKSPDL